MRHAESNAAGFKSLQEAVPEKSQFKAKISHFVDIDWENALKLLEWHIFRVQGMLNPMALVASLYDKWFLKNHNFRRHIAENGVKTIKMGWDICGSPPWVPFYPYTMFHIYLDLPVKNEEKP